MSAEPFAARQQTSTIGHKRTFHLKHCLSLGGILDSAAWGLIGTLVGALASAGTTWISTRSSYRIQREKQEDDRAERAKEFQRDTLLALQEAIHDTLRLGARAHIEDCKQFRQTGEWVRGVLSAELDEDIRLSRRKVAILIERIADDSLRSDIKLLVSLSAEGVLARSQKDAEVNQQAVAIKMTPILEKIGYLLRGYY